MNKFHVSNPNGLQVDIVITDVVVVLNFYFDILNYIGCYKKNVCKPLHTLFFGLD